LRRLTFIDASWDVMEPIAFMVSQAWIVVAYVWFMWHGREYAYDDAVRRLAAARKAAARLPK